jgi:O-succinylbenzoic acid--CoA ligase
VIAMVEKLTYPFRSIILNGRSVDIFNIISGNVTTHSEFEKNTIGFIKDWLNHVHDFTINTSGSTGAPKKIKITRTQMEHSALMTIRALDLQKGDTALVCLNTQYIAGKMMLVRALTGNLKIIATEPALNPLLALNENFDFVALVPLQLESILKSENFYQQINRSKAIIVGGAAINPALQNLLLSKITTPVFATYGMTETISHIALQRMNGFNTIPCFKLLPGIKIRQDERGCLVVDAPYLKTTIQTNDLVKILDDDTFTWLGRWDNLINTGGIKVIPEEIETGIQKILPSFNIDQNFFICGVPDASLGQKIVLVVEGDIDTRWGDIFDKLKQSFSKYVTPKEILNSEKFIYTKTGKIDRKASTEQMMAQYFTNKKH